MTAISRPVLMLAMPLSYGIPLWSDRTHDTRIPPLYKALFPSVAVAFNEPRGTYISVSLRVPFVPVRRNDGSAVLIATPFDFDLATFTEKRRMQPYFRIYRIFNHATLLLFILFNNLLPHRTDIGFGRSQLCRIFLNQFFYQKTLLRFPGNVSKSFGITVNLTNCK